VVIVDRHRCRHRYRLRRPPARPVGLGSGWWLGVRHRCDGSTPGGIVGHRGHRVGHRGHASRTSSSTSWPHRGQATMQASTHADSSRRAWLGVMARSRASMPRFDGSTPVRHAPAPAPDPDPRPRASRPHRRTWGGDRCGQDAHASPRWII